MAGVFLVTLDGCSRVSKQLLSGASQLGTVLFKLFGGGQTCVSTAVAPSRSSVRA